MSSDNILVAIKSRPLISRETSEKLRPQWAVQDKNIFQIDEDGHRLSEPYSFDHIFTEYTTNANVYKAVVEPLVNSFLSGFNSTIFAYGQTSSGKTHTMMGTDSIPGIIQLAISDVFQHVSHNVQRRYLISCSYFEIYNEKINDLLDKNGQDLKIREDYCNNIFVNAKEEVVMQASQVYDLMKVGSKIRKIGCTNMNERSSRSHTIFRLMIKSTENNVEHGSVQVSYLNLVDLAGSERIAHTKAAGVRLKEGVNINKSLLALGNVIRQLSEGEGFINYRDSNLTRLLQHALGGNAKSLIIATITIAAGEETKSTLEFAQRAKIIKNKPIINEIQSEQDKLKQFESVTANYKERLEKEKRRIKEMEHEKEEREREILKLKQQVKLIDLFTNGPEERRSESKIPRRHTLGHYTSRVPLQTIPESRILPFNVMQEKPVGNGTKRDLKDEELFFKRASQISDYDYMKMVIEESLDDGILSVTPEPSEELLIQEETTPTSQLRDRLKYMEESYLSLQEFTKLESQCKEDKDIIQDLVKEKENLLKDLIDMNIIIKDTRQEKEKIKMTCEEQLNSLKTDLELVKKKSDEYSFALERAETEKDALRLAKEQMLVDNEVLLEQQRLKYENQLQYLTNEIDKLNEGKEYHKADQNFEEEIQRLRKENEDYKLNTDEITTYKKKIVELEEKLRKFEKEEEEDFDILSVSTQTEEIPEAKQDVKAELKDSTSELIIMQENFDDLKDKMQELNNKLEHMQSLNITLEEELRESKEKNSAFLEIEISNNNMKNEIVQKQEEIDILLTKLRNLENENQTHKYEINVQKEQVQSKDVEIIELLNKAGCLEKDNRNNEEKVTMLLKQIENLEGENQQNKKKIDEGASQIEHIANLENKIEHLEKTNQSCEDKILFYKAQIESKENDIAEFAIKIKNLEINLKNYMEEFNFYKNDIELKESKILLQIDKISQLENDINIYQNELISSATKIKDQEKIINSFDEKLKPFEEAVKTLEIDNKCYKDEVQTFKKVVLLKDDEIRDLKCKLDAVQTEQAENVADLVMHKDEIELKNKEVTALQDKINKLEKDNENYKQEILVVKQEVSSKDNKITTLSEKVVDLEKDNQQYKGDVPDKEGLIQQIEHLRDENKIHKQINVTIKEEINVKDRLISELNDAVANLEKMHFSNKEEIQYRDEKILKLNDKIENLRNECSRNEYILTTYQSEAEIYTKKISELNNQIDNFEIENRNLKSQLSVYENEISVLLSKIKALKKCNDNHKNEIQTKDDHILEMRNKITDLEESCYNDKESIQTRDNQILELTDKINNLEKHNNDIKEENQARDNEILELRNRMKDLEKRNRDSEECVLVKDNNIMELTERIKDLEKSNFVNKEQIQSREDEILELANKIRDLEKNNCNNNEEISMKNKQITELIVKIEDLEKCNDNMKENVEMRNKQISESKTTIETLNKQLLEFTENVKTLEDDISRYKNDIQSKDKTITELQKKISDLDETCHHYEDEVSQCKEEVFIQEQKIKDLTSKMDKGVKHRAAEECSEEEDVRDLNRRIVVLVADKRRLEKLISDIFTEKDKEKMKNQELESRMRNMYLDNVGLRTKIFDLENVITELKSNSLSGLLETRNTHHSSTSSSSLELSPKELRKRKRQSIHDQRRGIDLAAVAGACEDEEATEESSIKEKEKEKGLKEKIKQMRDKIEFLSNENDSLEYEVQGFIRELDDCKKYKKERDDEIDMLKEQIEKMKLGQGQEDCKECPQKQHHIKKLEDLQRQNKFKIVELQTKIYDLQNACKAEKDNTEEKERLMNYHIKKLETRLGDRPLPKLKNTGLQCDLVDIDQLLEKYSCMKKLARMRRDEGNILRARLGMNTDEPVT